MLPGVVKRNINFFSVLLLMTLLSLGSRRFATAFLTGYTSRAPFLRAFEHVSAGHQRQPQNQPRWQLAALSTRARKQQTLVVHGPTDVSSSTARPFKLVIVESPSKCQTISKILQKYVVEHNLDHDYVVTSCMGHIRNIPQKKTHKKEVIAGIDLENGYTPSYSILPEKTNLVKELKKLADQSQQLILATDDDREGEAMAWHLLQVLVDEPAASITKQQSLDPNEGLPPLRVRFTEITPKAITESIFQHASTSLQDNLVRAQETRRVLDRLAGFTVSPVLWKKIAPGLSAGRVQSVGMALLVQRERERLLFQETEYWDIQANFMADTKISLPGQLVAINGTTLANGGSDYDARNAGVLKESSKHKLHLTQDDATALVERMNIEEWTWMVDSVNATKRRLNPAAPFITSTLQQESNKRLGLSVSQSMRVAQELYEKGYISYMRTDSTNLSEDAKEAIRLAIMEDHGGIDNYQPTTRSKRGGSKKSSTKAEPQAAHEAVRPAIQPDGRFASPKSLPHDFDPVTKKLYELIYARTVASHMPPQVSNQTTIRIRGDSNDTSVQFRSSGSVVVQPGYTILYPKSEKDAPNIPHVQEGQPIQCRDVTPQGHTSQPPPRFTEASFVQELEALGVGRPSTYAGTVQILRDRAYVGSPVSSGSPTSRGRSKVVSGPAISAQRAAGGEEFTGVGKARGPMVPSLSAFVVCSLLEEHCNMYVDPSFTAKMEERLDRIANSEEDVNDEERVAYLDEFYAGESGLASQIQRIADKVDADDARRARLPALEWDPSSGKKEVGLFVGPWGPYAKEIPKEENGSDEKVATANLPAGMASDLSQITLKHLTGLISSKEKSGSVLGQHPDDNRNIRLKLGRFGAYLQWGDDGEEGTTSHTLPSHLRRPKYTDMEDTGTEEKLLNNVIGISFEQAVQYVNLPRTVCVMDDEPVVAAIGPYGSYLKYKSTYVNLKPTDPDILEIDAATAHDFMVEGLNNKSKTGKGVLAEIGEKEGSMITVKSGRFGMYINWKRVNAKLPNDYFDKPSDLPVEEAWSLIQEKAGSEKPSKSKAGKEKNPSVQLPEAPKRPLSAYLHFCAEKRPVVSASEKKLGAISKELARLWADVSEEEKKPFVELAKVSKTEYEEKKKVWTEECQGILTKHGGTTGKAPTRKRVVSKGDIKRSKSSYLFFCAAKRAEVAARFSRLGDVSKELGRMWGETPASERKEFEDMAAEDKLRYEREKNAQTGNKESQGGSMGAKTKKKRGPSAYMLFCAAHRDQIVDETGKKLPLGETTKRLAKMWKACDDATRNHFQAEADKRKPL